MNRIFKYPLRVEHRQVVYMATSAVPLWVAEVNMELVLYAHVDVGDTTATERLFAVVTTGDELDAEADFIGACTLGGWFQAFVFELITVDAKRSPIDRRHTEDFRQIKEEQTTRPPRRPT